MSKYEQALNTLYDATLNKVSSVDKEKAYQTLQELVDKATPKKVVETYYDLQESDLDNELHCPNCKETIMDREMLEEGYMKIPYCHYCGQKLDWSEYE